MKTHAHSTLVARLGALVAFGLATQAHGCGGHSTVPDKAAGIEVVITASSHANDPNNRIPISFDASKAETFTVDLRMYDLSGATRTSFSGDKAWVRLSVQPGQIVGTVGAGGPSDPTVVGANVELTAGVAKSITVSLVGAYGDTRIIAQDVGFVPAPAGKLAQCADGIDNDGNGYADYPVDPGCLFQNDDLEGTFDGSYGVSSPIYYFSPRIHDIQGPGSSPFNGHQVDIPGDAVHMYVSALTKDGMFITDVEDDLPAAARRGFNSLFIYNFNPPPEIHVCDRITRLDGNVSVFVGSIQLGTAAWVKQPWLNEKASGPCPLPDYIEVTDAIATSAPQMQAVQGSLIRVKNPVIGTHFGRKIPPLVDDGSGTGSLVARPVDGASNCDLNGDAIAGCIKSKGGYRVDEDACCKACTADPDCTEWNDFRKNNQVKIHFGAGGTLFAKFSQVTNFDPTQFVGAGKFAEVRGSVGTFSGTTPNYSIAARCADDVILVGQDPSTVRDSKHACVCYRDAPDAECTF